MVSKLLIMIALMVAILLSCSDDITNIYYVNTEGAVFGNVEPADSGTATLDGLVHFNTPIDANGFFNFANVTPGKYELSLIPKNHGRRKIRNVIVGTGVTNQIGETPIDKYPFPIYSVVPQDGSQGVSTSGYMTIRCDESLDLDDLNQMTQFDPPVGGVWYAFDDYYYYDDYYGGYAENPASFAAYSFSPENSLLPGTNYTMTINRQVRTESGTLDGDLTLTFTTRPFFAFVDVDANSRTGHVSRRGFRATVGVFICTSKELMAEAVNFQPEVEGEWFSADSYTRCSDGLFMDFAFLASDLPLLPKTHYRVIVRAEPFGATGVDTVAFLTEGYEVINVLPRNGYYGVPVDNQVLVIFNEAMDTLSARQALTVSRVGGDEVPGTVGWNAQGTEMMWSHWDNPYTIGQYLIKVTRQAETAGGDTLDVGWESYFQVL